MTMNKWLISLSIAAALANPAAQAAGDAAAGQEKSAVCAGCHNADGNSVNPLWPKIAGQHPGYIVQQLQDFKSGARQDPVMAPMAMPLSDEDMVNLAAYFSAQEQTHGEAAEDRVERGEKLYRGGNLATGVSACAACHAPNGVGNPAANFPALAGQHATYVEKALKEFRAGTRNNDNAQMMQNVAARMTDDEIAAVAQYIQGLR
jgi:cytochrome c553